MKKKKIPQQTKQIIQLKFSNDNKKEETNDLNNKNIEEKNNNNFNNIKYLIGDDN